MNLSKRRPIQLEINSIFSMSSSENNADIVRKYFKRWPVFYYFIKIVFGPVMYGGLSAKKFLKKYPKPGRTLNIGSGPQIVESGVVNVDIHPFGGVDIVADAKSIPVPDDSVSRIISDNVLEHLPDPGSAVKEMKRILLSGGLVYISTPFLYPFHGSPNDYQRWTTEGIRELLKDFEILEIGVRGGGPFSTLSVTLCYIGATIFSFGSERIYWLLVNMFMFVFFPIKFLDIIFSRWPRATNVAAVLFCVAKKK